MLIVKRFYIDFSLVLSHVKFGHLVICLLLFCLVRSCAKVRDHFLQHLYNNLSSSSWDFVLVLLWYMWFARNKMVHDDGLITPLEVIQFAMKYGAECFDVLNGKLLLLFTGVLHRLVL